MDCRSRMTTFFLVTRQLKTTGWLQVIIILHFTSFCTLFLHTDWPCILGIMIRIQKIVKTYEYDEIHAEISTFFLIALGVQRSTNKLLLMSLTYRPWRLNVWGFHFLPGQQGAAYLHRNTQVKLYHFLSGRQGSAEWLLSCPVLPHV